jgi:BON domain-containing protein
MSPLLLGAVLGASGAFLLDPELGRRRRALIRDKVTRGVTESREFADAATKDLQQRARGVSSRVKRLRAGGSPDEALVARVRAKLGRYCSHPGAIEVTAFNGRVVLTGDVLASEREQIFEAVRTVRGVEQVDNSLSAHQSAEGVSSLQGGSAPERERFALLQENWSPGIRLVTGGAGALLLLYALVRGGLSSIGALGVGAVLLGRATTNQPLRRAFEATARRQTHREVA